MLKILLTTLALTALASPVSAGEQDTDEQQSLCYLDGPYSSLDNDAAQDRAKIKEAAKKIVENKGFTFAPQARRTCVDAEAGDKQCLMSSSCAEALYIKIEEAPAVYTFEIVSFRRGEIRGAAAGEQALLDEIAAKLDALLSRPKKLLSTEEQKKLEQLKKRKIDLVPLQGEVDHLSHRQKHKKLIISLAAVTSSALIAAGISIGTAAVAKNNYDDIKDTPPVDRDKSEIDKITNLNIASRTTLGVACAAGLAAAVLLPFTIKSAKQKKSALTPAVTASRTGGMLTIQGEF